MWIMDIEQAIQYVLNKNGYSQLKPNQKSVIEQYLKGSIYCFAPLLKVAKA